jgi:hypothetical protein
VDPPFEPVRLLLLADLEPVLHEDDAVLDEHPLENGHLAQEQVVLLGGAESEHALDAGAVVPAAVEQHDLAGRRQVLHITLEIPLRLLALCRHGQSNRACGARVHEFDDPLDRTALPGGVPSLEEHEQARPRRSHPFLHLHKFLLQASELLLVGLPWILACWDSLHRVAHGGTVPARGHVRSPRRRAWLT